MPIESTRSRGITRDDVWQAADALLKAGQRPTIERIRLHLGRGSPNTVSPHLDAWFAALGGRLQDAQAFAPTTGYPDPVGQAARYLWEAALNEARAAAESALAERETALRQAESALAAQRDQLAQEREVLQARLEGAETAMAELVRTRDDAVERATRAEAALVALQGQADALLAQRASAQQEKDDLRREFAAQRAAWDQEREIITERAGASERRMALELDAARVAAKEGQKVLEAERRAAMERLAHAAELASRQGGEMTRLGNALAVLEERIRQREGLLAEYRQRLESGQVPPGAVRRQRLAGKPAIGRSTRFRTRPPVA